MDRQLIEQSTLYLEQGIGGLSPYLRGDQARLALRFVHNGREQRAVLRKLLKQYLRVNPRFQQLLQRNVMTLKRLLGIAESINPVDDAWGYYSYLEWKYWIDHQLISESEPRIQNRLLMTSSLAIMGGIIFSAHLGAYPWLMWHLPECGPLALLQSARRRDEGAEALMKVMSEARGLRIVRTVKDAQNALAAGFTLLIYPDSTNFVALSRNIAVPFLGSEILFMTGSFRVAEACYAKISYLVAHLRLDREGKGKIEWEFSPISHGSSEAVAEQYAMRLEGSLKRSLCQWDRIKYFHKMSNAR